MRRVVDDKEHQVVGARVDETVHDVGGNLDQGARLGLPELLTELYAAGAAEEVERVWL
jgi:hypothetical protein